MLKKAVLLITTALVLSNCGSSGGSSSKEDENVKPQSVEGLSIYNTTWRGNFERGYMIMNVQFNQVTMTTYCDSGLTASASAPATITETTIEILLSRSKESRNSSGETCSISIKKTGPTAYRIDHYGRLCVENDCLNRSY